tara:strand:- start:6 stop:134 length:129 start_codon:yes stop_codon:yes gene_type:complete
MSLNALVVEYLFNDKTKEKLLKEVNKNVNIPLQQNPIKHLIS